MIRSEEEAVEVAIGNRFGFSSSLSAAGNPSAGDCQPSCNQ